MDISISSSNFVKRKEFDALCNVVNQNAEMLNGIKYITEVYKEQFSALGELIDVQEDCLDKEIQNISIAIVDTLPPKFQKPLADRIIKILQNSRKEYAKKCSEATDKLKKAIEDIEK